MTTDFKQHIKPEFHAAYDQYLIDLDTLSEDEIWTKYWNDGNMQDHAKVPFIALTSSEETGYCITYGGYFNDTIFTNEILTADATTLIRFVDEYADAHDQVR